MPCFKVKLAMDSTDKRIVKADNIRELIEKGIDKYENRIDIRFYLINILFIFDKYPSI